MGLNLELNISQRLVLSQTIRQSLHILELPLMGLNDYVEQLALSNPLIDLDPAPLGDFPLDYVMRNAESGTDMYEQNTGLIEDEPDVYASQSRISITRPGDYGYIDTDPDGEFNNARGNIYLEDQAPDFSTFLSRPKTLNEYLHEQLGVRKQIEESCLSLVSYLIDNLDDSGYMSIPLEEIADELDFPLSDVEEALYVLQSFDPPGVGARSLYECLLIQLANTDSDKSFWTPGRDNSDRELTFEILLKLISTYLEPLAKSNYKKIAKNIGISEGSIRKAARVIKSLNPIPSRGFFSGESPSRIIPDALITVENSHIRINVNQRALPRVNINNYYKSLMKSNDSSEDTRQYVREKLKEANDVIDGIAKRVSTLEQVLGAIVSHQENYFLRGDALKPLTRNELADELHVSNSTISRAVQNKFIQFKGRVRPLGDFFTNGIGSTKAGTTTSSQAIKNQLKRMIEDENPSKPLSDQAISDRFASLGINISRRAIANYRLSLSIPSTSARRKSF